MGYGAVAWGSKVRTNCINVENRAICCFLGVLKLTPNLAICVGVGWEQCVVRQKGDMVSLWKRLINIPEHIITNKKVYNYNLTHNYPWV